MTIKNSSEEQHDEMISVMRQYFDDEKPQVGIFWYDYVNNKLFGVEKDDAERYMSDREVGTIHKLHRTYWHKQHHRAVATGDTASIFYVEQNYTMIPSGCIFVRRDGTCYVTVGSWIDGTIDGKEVIDAQKLHELIEDEFNLPPDFEFVVDSHWDIGHGWSEDF